jgi:SAM-dependent methyltransferase
VTAPLGSARLFVDHRGRVDSVVVLYGLAQAVATDATRVVEVGCGRGVHVDPEGQGRRLHDLRAPGRHVLGIDVDPVGAENPVLDEFRLIDGDHWPLEDDGADLVVCDWVLEHVQDPAAFVAELRRVLRPGGVFLARTVNRRSVLAVGSRAVPQRAHARVLARLQPGRQEQDVFPTAYLMNSRAQLAPLLDGHFEWTTSTHPGLEHYAARFPRVGGVLSAAEVHLLPGAAQTALVVAARLL